MRPVMHRVAVWINKVFTAWRTQQQNARRSRVDELIQHVVAQGDVNMTSKGNSA